jgi:hypothetical protein
MALRRVFLSGFLTVIFFIVPSLRAQLPGVNLGFNSFMDGMPPPAGPGWYMQEYLQYFHGNRFLDGNGNRIRIPTSGGTFESPELDAWIWLHQVFYQSPQEILPEILPGARWGVSATLPTVALEVTPDDFFGFEEESFSVGDLFLGPSLQWDPIMGKQGPIFSHRIELDAVFPVGTYDPDKQLNGASNHFSFNPYWAGTLFLRPEWNVSWRLHYLWNGENDETHIQPGQAIHLNFATSVEVIPRRLHVGLNGYLLEQITDSQFNGVDIPNSRESVIGVGPGILYAFSERDLLFVNAYAEMEARNRPEGMRFGIRWLHKF